MCLSLNQCCVCGTITKENTQIDTDLIFMEPWMRTTVDGYGKITSKMRDLVSNLDLRVSARLT